jgi:hypothetical protein
MRVRGLRLVSSGDMLRMLLAALYIEGDLTMAMSRDERQALIEQYATGYDAVLDALEGITEGEWDSREAAGEWCTREIAHHLGDSEMSAAVRIRALIADEEPIIQGFDQERWTEALYPRDRPIEPSLAAFKAAREATLPLLRLMTDEQWTREGRHSQFGPMSPEHWLEWYGPHAHGHADQIRRARAAAHG